MNKNQAYKPNLCCKNSVLQVIGDIQISLVKASCHKVFIVLFVYLLNFFTNLKSRLKPNDFYMYLKIILKKSCFTIKFF